MTDWRRWTIGWARGLPGVINAARGMDPGTVVFTVREDTPDETYAQIHEVRPDGVAVQFDVRATRMPTPPGRTV
jgi:hypothetical protein